MSVYIRQADLPKKGRVCLSWMKNDHVENIIQTFGILNRKRRVTARKRSRHEKVHKNQKINCYKIITAWNLKEPASPLAPTISISAPAVSHLSAQIIKESVCQSIQHHVLRGYFSEDPDFLNVFFFTHFLWKVKGSTHTHTHTHDLGLKNE